MKKKAKTSESLLAQELAEQFTRQTGMLLEQIRSEVRVVAEGHGNLSRQMEELREDLRNEMKEGFAAARAESRAIAKDLASFKSEMFGFRSEMQEFRSEMFGFKHDTTKRLDRIENTLDTVVNDHEKRITKVEEKLAV